jgi:hypothetical protein
MFQSRNCPSCGATIQLEANHCPLCGSQVKHRPVIPPNATPPDLNDRPGRSIPEKFGARLREAEKENLRRELEDSLHGAEQLGAATVSSPGLSTTTVMPLAMPEQREEFKSSQLSIISYGQAYPYVVEYRPGKHSPAEIVEGRPITSGINSETIKGLEDVYIGQVLKTMRQIGSMPPEQVGARGKLLQSFHDTLVSFGKFLTDAIGPDVMNAIFNSPQGSRLQLRLDESALGIPWELANLGNESSILGLHYSIGKTVVSNKPTAENRRGPRKETKVLMIAAAAEPTSRGLPVLKGFVPVLERLEKSLLKQGVAIRKIIGREATSANVQRALSDDNDIVIFNTHGGFGDEEPTTTLATADGALFSQDIQDIYLRSKYPPPLLWVSYACETGTQRSWDKTTESLPATLNRLNVPFVGPYWPAWGGAEESSQPLVSSDMLLSAFFEKIFASPPSTLGDALMYGKRKLFNNEQRTFPDWANFTLYGSPSLAIGLRN